LASWDICHPLALDWQPISQNGNNRGQADGNVNKRFFGSAQITVFFLPRFSISAIVTLPLPEQLRMTEIVHTLKPRGMAPGKFHKPVTKGYLINMAALVFGNLKEVFTDDLTFEYFDPLITRILNTDAQRFAIAVVIILYIGLGPLYIIQFLLSKAHLLQIKIYKA
jgi:hypothetical protein